jgi:hypothetical protein
MVLAVSCALAPPLGAAEPGCGQALIDGTVPRPTAATIAPARPARPFYQWENNNGYCGEVSMMQAGMANGLWMSQFYARLICGTGLSQSGPNGACAAHGRIPNYNAQLLIETSHTGVSGPHRFADAALCLGNARLDATTFPYLSEPGGLVGYRAYMAWVKGEVIAGHQVAMAVLYNGGHDPQYDHEVTVLRVGTNHDPFDPRYYPDDVVYFDDHGAYTLKGEHYTTNPAIPPGAGDDAKGCTPYVFGYRFDALPRSRAEANAHGAPAYSVIVPDDRVIHTGAGGDGYDTVPIRGPHNYGFAVSGPADPDGETRPVSLAIDGPTVTRGVANPPDPVAGWDYENPMIGRSVAADGCTNAAPLPWMSHLELRVTAHDLTPGRAYVLYEYDLPPPDGVGHAAAFSLPVRRFNAQAARATRATGFSAWGRSYAQTVTIRSDRIVAFRCVPADGP